MTINHRGKYIVVLVLFILAAAITFFSAVERRVHASAIDLNSIPAHIGDWHMLSQATSLSSLETTFLDDVLFRTYQRRDGKTIMLAIAYGADQRKRFSLHLPEVCYQANGYTVTDMGEILIDSPHLRLKKLLMKDATGQTEPVQYWIVLNGKVVTSDFERKLIYAYNGFFGAEAGGLLVRVSSLSTEGDVWKDYEVQKEFIAALYETLNTELRTLFFGKNI